MTCARREAGARPPAPATSAGAPRKADARTGRARARLFGLLPALALLLGALGLFAATPASAQITGITWTAIASDSTETTVSYSPAYSVGTTSYTGTYPAGTASLKVTVEYTQLYLFGTVPIHPQTGKGDSTSKCVLGQEITTSGGSQTYSATKELVADTALYFGVQYVNAPIDEGGTDTKYCFEFTEAATTPTLTGYTVQYRLASATDWSGAQSASVTPVAPVLQSTQLTGLTVKDPHVAMALRLEAAFGLRREEAIKFRPARDDRGGCIRLKGSTTKGGRPREVPVRNAAQRALLDEARRLVGGRALIPPERSYRQQLKVYESQTREAGLYRMHGLRHGYTLERYEELTGWKAPAAGGPARRTLTGARRRIDTAARRTIAQELGHRRASITSVYCG